MTKRKPVHTVAVDWDGTAVEPVWPKQATQFRPGFVEAMRDFHEAGFRLLIHTARLNPYNAFTHKERSPGEIATEEHAIRALLDAHGLSFIGIWNKPGKPSASVYIDDKAERYNQSNNAWKAMTHRVKLRLGAEDPLFPAFDLEAT